MDSQEFRKHAMELVDYICNYNETLHERRVTPNVEPGYLRPLLPSEAPENPDSWDEIMRDFESKIMLGMAHWQHPQFHAYFPAGTSYPCILAEMLITATNCLGFSWVASPASTELETIVCDWLGKAMGLPDIFLSSAAAKGSKGGGVIESSASECILVVMLAARAQAIRRLKMQHPSVEDGILLTKLIAYCSREAHACVEKAAMIAFVKIRIIDTDENAKKLVKMMEEDEYEGLEPFFVSTTYGTTASCAFDDLEEIGMALQGFPHVWLHVDGAYAASAFLCPEMRPLMKGIEYANSIDVNPHKWLLTAIDCSILFVRDTKAITSALVVDPLYLAHQHPDAIDYRHWSITLTRRFRALKLWFVLRCYGISGLQKHIRNHIELAKYFEGLLRADNRFEVCNKVKMGLVCFRLVGPDFLNETFLKNINSSGILHMIPAKVAGRYIIRFGVNAPNITKQDIDKSWGIITRYATDILRKSNALFDFVSSVEKEKLDEMIPYFIRMTCNPRKSEAFIFEPEEESEEGEEAKKRLMEVAKSRRRDSWISFPLGFLLSRSSIDEGPAVPIV